MELLVTIIILALIFDYINGFHDAANSIATIVSTRVLTPFQAVLWAAFFNFVAFFIAKYIIGGFGIANTVSKTVVEQYITLPIILAGVIAAITWNLITWWKGIPSSSSHTLIGGFAGAAIMANGFEAIQLNIILKIAAFIFLAPFIGMVIAFGFTLFVLYICRRAHPHTAEQWFKRLQLVSSALFSVGHGLNDSQKVMGIIAAAMIAAHSMGLGMGINSINDLPDWVAFSCFTAISLGTMSGGWKIVKTMGTRITKVTPLEGVIAETAGAFTLYITEMLKIPVSTTHTITGAIIGVGATKRLSAVRWGVIAAITWNLITWWKGIPSSSSHTLIGGFAGAAIMANGFEAIQLNIILKIAAFIFLAPFIGMVIAFGFTLFVLYICRRAHPHTAEQWFKRLQLVSSALFSVGHGLNDSQKVMGIIAAAMIAAHSMGLGMGINSINDLPDWVAFSCFTAISLGTMSGGWKIVKTMGTRITKVTPLEGVIAETAGAFTLYITEMLKIPVSTTHTITGAIIGVGATKRLSAVRWGVTKSLMTAWILTIPVSGLLAAGVYFIVSLFI